MYASGPSPTGQMVQRQALHSVSQGPCRGTAQTITEVAHAAARSCTGFPPSRIHSHTGGSAGYAGATLTALLRGGLGGQ